MAVIVIQCGNLPLRYTDQDRYIFECVSVSRQAELSGIRIYMVYEAGAGY